MSRKTSLLITLLLIVLVLSACGGDKKGNKSAGQVELTQTLESRSGITIKYPGGWVAEEMTAGVRVASSASGLALLSSSGQTEIPTGMAGAVAQVLPLDKLGVPAGTLIKDVLTQLVPNMTGGDAAIKIGEIVEVKVSGRDAARTSLSSDTAAMAGVITVIQLDDDTIMLVSYLARQDEFTNFEGILSKIVENISYAAPGQ